MIGGMSIEKKQEMMLKMMPMMELMMARIMPHWLENMLPHLSEERRAVFVASMKSILETTDQKVYSS